MIDGARRLALVVVGGAVLVGVVITLRPQNDAAIHEDATALAMTTSNRRFAKGSTTCSPLKTLPSSGCDSWGAALSSNPASLRSVSLPRR